MATQMTTQRNIHVATIIKNIQHHEEIKQSSKLLQTISKGNQGGAVLFLRNSAGFLLKIMTRSCQDFCAATSYTCTNCGTLHLPMAH
eukprot:8401580-Ditylum_brightwellii.AAC.1